MSYCPLKFNVGERRVFKKPLECEGVHCEWFNPNYGRCGKYVETLTIDERVELERKNGKKI